MANAGPRIDRRDMLRIMGATAVSLALPHGSAFAQTRKDTLVLGLDISYTLNLDPARALNFTGPETVSAAYETLLTFSPGDYINLKPLLATEWKRTPDGKGWRLTLREGVKFASGNVMTADDVKFSIDRVVNLKDQPSQYLTNLARIDVVDARTVDLILKDPAAPILTILTGPSFSILDRKTVEALGGTSAADAKDKDKASAALNQESAGTGPFKQTKWERNAQIQLVANPNYWRGRPPFQRIVIRHMDESGAQLLALRNGDIDAAFNLTPEQVESLKSSKDVHVVSHTSLDFVYLALSSNPEFNPALAKKAARQAVGYAIDYDGIRDALFGGAATRPASFLPIGVIGSTEEIAREIGFRQDLDKSRKLLAEAGYPQGFEFEMSYGNGAVSGSSFNVLAQKLQADLARVGIKAKLVPMDMTTFRTQFVGQKSKAAITTWTPTGIENQQWASSSVERVAKRVHWTPTDELMKLVDRASAEPDRKKQAELWKEYQVAMVDQANLIMLFQPIFRVGVRNEIKSFPLTAAGWKVELFDVKRG